MNADQSMALVISRPWIDMILDGEKTWEIRGTNTKIRGRIYLAGSGTGRIFGQAELTDVKGPLTEDEFRHSAKFHRAPRAERRGPLPYRNTYAWILCNTQRFPRPMRYQHPSGAITWVKLADFFPGTEYFETTPTPARHSFVESFAVDLKRLGHEVSVAMDSSSVRLSVTYHDDKFSDLDHVRSVYRIVAAEASTLRTCFDDHEVPALETIRPRLSICTDEKDHNAFDAVRRIQSLPTSPGLGRFLHAVVWDDGCNPPRPMGAIGLSGASYAIQCRDEFLSWSASRSATRRIAREQGLRNLMHLFLCIAAPPYNRLRVARLLALLAFSTPIVEEYQKRWGDHLLAITTTSAFGPHGAIFRRIHPNRLAPKSRYVGYSPQLFHHIGDTSGEYFPVVSERTRELAAAFLKADCPGALEAATGFGDEGMVKKAMAEANLPRDLLRFVKMGYFIGYLHSDCLQALRGELMPLFSYHLAPEHCVEYWKTEICRSPLSQSDQQPSSPANEYHT